MWEREREIKTMGFKSICLGNLRKLHVSSIPCPKLDRMHWIWRCVEEINFDMCWLRSSISSSSSQRSSNDGRSKWRACNEPSSSNFGLILKRGIKKLVTPKCRISRCCLTLKWYTVLLQAYLSKREAIHIRLGAQDPLPCHEVFAGVIYRYH